MLLANVRKTSPGNDGILYWVFRDCAGGLSQVISKLINYSLSIGKVPSIWKIAAITPVPKTNPVSMPSDLRPISKTPILSRLVERLVVRDLIMSNVSPANLYDQYEFKPTGSTTAALVDLTHTVTVMLETNKYVRCLLIVFSKAFDSIDHAIIVKKIVDLGLDQNVIDWVVTFFE